MIIASRFLAGQKWFSAVSSRRKDGGKHIDLLFLRVQIILKLLFNVMCYICVLFSSLQTVRITADLILACTLQILLVCE